jgi:hypothetical protein
MNKSPLYKIAESTYHPTHLKIITHQGLAGDYNWFLNDSPPALIDGCSTL